MATSRVMDTINHANDYLKIMIHFLEKEELVGSDLVLGFVSDNDSYHSYLHTLQAITNQIALFFQDIMSTIISNDKHQNK